MKKTYHTLQVILLVVLAYCVVQYVVPLFSGRKLVLSQQQIDSLMATGQTKHLGAYRSYNAEPLDAGIEQQSYETFRFDPNTADTTTLLRLGLPRWMIRSMLKYRAAGGRYGRASDMQRIPGMTPEIYERLAPYIVIDPKYKPYDPVALAMERESERKAVRQAVDSIGHTTLPYKLRSGELLDLNTADSAELCMVPGIAGYRARTIINYRNRLGGFIDVSQLKDIADIPDSCARWLYVEAVNPRQINLNTASLGQMAKHPYIGKRYATLINNYRHVHGAIHSLDDLSLHPDFNDSIIQRIQPYVCFQ